MDIGLESVAQTAREFGLRTPSGRIRRCPSAPDVVPMQLAEAYTVFANGGTRSRARPILRVEDAQGRVLWEPQPDVEQVANPAAVAITRDLLQTALNNGTGYPARNPAQGGLPYTVPAAGKTGTTNDATDVWFAGFTPNLLGVVWFGFDRPQPHHEQRRRRPLRRARLGRFMRDVYAGEDAGGGGAGEPWTGPMASSPAASTARPAASPTSGVRQRRHRVLHRGHRADGGLQPLPWRPVRRAAAACSRTPPCGATPSVRLH
jgi:membrane peptidoglycan carboxypeptidase